MQFSGKIGQISMLAPPSEVGAPLFWGWLAPLLWGWGLPLRLAPLLWDWRPPPLGNPGSATVTVYLYSTST